MLRNLKRLVPITPKNSTYKTLTVFGATLGVGYITNKYIGSRLQTNHVVTPNSRVHLTHPKSSHYPIVQFEPFSSLTAAGQVDYLHEHLVFFENKDDLILFIKSLKEGVVEMGISRIDHSTLRALMPDSRDVADVIAALEHHKDFNSIYHHVIENTLEHILKSSHSEANYLIEYTYAEIKLREMFNRISNGKKISNLPKEESDIFGQIYYYPSSFGRDRDILFYHLTQNSFTSDAFKVLSKDPIACLLQLNAIKALNIKELKSQELDVIKTLTIHYQKQMKNLDEKTYFSPDSESNCFANFHHLLASLRNSKLLTIDNLNEIGKIEKPKSIINLINTFTDVNYLNENTLSFIINNNELAESINGIMYQVLYYTGAHEWELLHQRQKFILESVLTNVKLFPSIANNKEILNKEVMSSPEKWNSYIIKLGGKSIPEPTMTLEPTRTSSLRMA